MNVYEILIMRGKRRRLMENYEDPFERIERQMRTAKRFRLEEYIKSLGIEQNQNISDEEKKQRFAFFCREGEAKGFVAPTVRIKKEQPENENNNNNTQNKAQAQAQAHPVVDVPSSIQRPVDRRSDASKSSTIVATPRRRSSITLYTESFKGGERRLSAVLVVDDFLNFDEITALDEGAEKFGQPGDGMCH